MYPMFDLQQYYDVAENGVPSQNGIKTSKSFLDYSNDYIDFTNSAPTSYHGIAYFSSKLKNSGFEFLSEREDWTDVIKPGHKYFTIRNGSSLVAFVIGANYKPANGAGVIGCHIDALTCKLKPISIKEPIDGFTLLGVAPYAGALSSLWWDRDLSIGGRVIVKTESGSFVTRLVKIPYPVAHIPSLAPHFGTPANGPFNQETQAVPVIGLEPTDPKEDEPTKEEIGAPLIGKHNIRLLRRISKELGISIKDIYDFDLELYDVQPSTLGGLNKEFLFAPRIDDRINSFAATMSLINTSDYLSESSDVINVVALFDSEEIGSLTRSGARGHLLESVLDRINNSSSLNDNGKNKKSLQQLYANSFFISADVTHAVNPNFDSVYLENHKPKLNVGVTISYDSNGHMSTDAISSQIVKEVAKRIGATLQSFQIRNDSRSGGTIGPFISSSTGMRAVDLGIAQLSMHSIRAMVGSKDVGLGVKFYEGFYKEWSNVDKLFNINSLNLISETDFVAL